ncbi:phage terminase small subunit P27 family [Mesorhizobium sp. A623]
MVAGVKPILKSIEGGLAKVPPAPRDLAPDAREEWRRAAKELIDLKILTKSDLQALEQYAIAAGMVKQLQAIASKSPPIISNEKSGAVKQHPAHVMLAKYLTLALRFAAELGLTPAGRHRKGMQQGSKADEGAPSWLDL